MCCSTALLRWFLIKDHFEIRACIMIHNGLQQAPLCLNGWTHIYALMTEHTFMPWWQNNHPQKPWHDQLLECEYYHSEVHSSPVPLTLSPHVIAHCLLYWTGVQFLTACLHDISGFLPCPDKNDPFAEGCQWQDQIEEDAQGDSTTAIWAQLPYEVVWAWY